MSPMRKIRSFWSFLPFLLEQRSALLLAALGAVASAVFFGLSLALIRPCLQVLLGDPPELPGSASGVVPSRQILDAFPGLAERIRASLPADPFWLITTLMSVAYAAGAMAGVCRYVHERFAAGAITNATMELRGRLFSRLVRVPVAFTLKHGTADSVSRIFNDVGVLSGGFHAVLSRSVGDLLRGLAALCVAFLLDWRLSLASLLCLPLAVPLLRHFNRVISQASESALQGYGRLLRIVQAAMAGLSVVKLHNAEGREESRFFAESRSVRDRELSIHVNRAVASPLFEQVTILGFFLITLGCAWFVFRSNARAADFIAVLVTLFAAGQSLRILAGLSQQISQAEGAAVRLRGVLDLEAEIRPGPATPGLLQEPEREIAFEDVTFHYPGCSQPALVGIDLRLPAKATVLLAGANGSGKTTLLHLLPRLLEPSRGRLLVDGMDIAGVPLGDLRSRIGMVPQEPFLFAGTIRENIAYGPADSSMREIQRAARAASAHRFIEDLPQEYDTRLGELGTGLSSGQKQRICVARALLRHPSILILDEATSHIDVESRERILEALEKLRGRMTVLVTSHRIEDFLNADLIVVLDNGRICELGGHLDLLECSAAYRNLFREDSQLLSGAPAP